MKKKKEFKDIMIGLQGDLKPFEIRELTPRNLYTYFTEVQEIVSKGLDVKNFKDSQETIEGILTATTNATFDNLIDCSFSELHDLKKGFQEVNKDFLLMLDTLELKGKVLNFIQNAWKTAMISFGLDSDIWETRMNEESLKPFTTTSEKEENTTESKPEKEKDQIETLPKISENLSEPSKDPLPTS